MRPFNASVTFTTVTVRPEGPYCAATVLRNADENASSVVFFGAPVFASNAAGARRISCEGESREEE